VAEEIGGVSDLTGWCPCSSAGLSVAIGFSLVCGAPGEARARPSLWFDDGFIVFRLLGRGKVGTSCCLVPLSPVQLDRIYVSCLF
jgi:hypothetical protein